MSELFSARRRIPGPVSIYWGQRRGGVGQGLVVAKTENYHKLVNNISHLKAGQLIKQRTIYSFALLLIGFGKNLESHHLMWGFTSSVAPHMNRGLRSVTNTLNQQQKKSNCDGQTVCSVTFQDGRVLYVFYGLLSWWICEMNSVGLCNISFGPPGNHLACLKAHCVRLSI